MKLKINDMKTIELKVKCDKCKGTGIYQGMAERDGSGVVCYNCNGTGCYNYKYEYDDFKEKVIDKNIKHVVESNPGIVIGTNKQLKFKNFGGITYDEWLKNSKFPKGSEMRLYVCPAWWYQSVDYDKKPKWDECISLGSFSQCDNFNCKEKCWIKFDSENINI